MLVAEVVQNGQSIGELLDKLVRNDAFWVFVLSSVLIPLINAALTRPQTSGLFKSGLTAVLAGISAVVAWITDAGGFVDNWRAALGIFVAAVLGAGGIHAAVVKGDVADSLGNGIPINIGPVMTPEKAMAKHGSASTIPVPEGLHMKQVMVVPQDFLEKVDPTLPPDHPANNG